MKCGPALLSVSAAGSRTFDGWSFSSLLGEQASDVWQLTAVLKAIMSCMVELEFGNCLHDVVRTLLITTSDRLESVSVFPPVSIIALQIQDTPLSVSLHYSSRTPPCQYHCTTVPGQTGEVLLTFKQQYSVGNLEASDRQVLQVFLSLPQVSVLPCLIIMFGSSADGDLLLPDATHVRQNSSSMNDDKVLSLWFTGITVNCATTIWAPLHETAKCETHQYVLYLVVQFDDSYTIWHFSFDIPWLATSQRACGRLGWYVYLHTINEHTGSDTR